MIGPPGMQDVEQQGGTADCQQAGHDGGRIVFEGTPADAVAARSTLTGQHLATYVGAGPTPSRTP